ncbi:P-loop containing nucleoside triphosphate hydrolase protein [Globomyces pollinis-pini]|nr:P-loop containing nucleoside triphosphate hydrolase protein [Globomyces pollinis-pini]
MYIAILLFALQLALAVFKSIRKNIDRTVQQSIRTTMIGAIYEKSLILSPASKLFFTNGKIMNMINQDTLNLIEAPIIFTRLWSVPVQVIVTFVLLYGIIGRSVFIGVGLMGLLGLFSLLLGPVIGKAYNGWFTGADERISIVREMLYGIKVIKFQCMEEYFWRKIQQARDAQLKSLRKMAVYLSILDGFLFSAPLLLTVITFAVYANDNKLTPSIAFPALAYFNALVNPLIEFADIMSVIPTALKSLQRVNEFLDCEEMEIKKNNIEMDVDTDSIIRISNATWEWTNSDVEPPTEKDSSTNFCLKSLNLDIKRGELVGIVGPIGSGKSSLFSGLIGDSVLVDGKVSINGSIAYCSQQSWIISGTIESNILFNTPLDQVRLDEVIEVTGLSKDLTLFGDGLKTKIGESGVNLSGGQKSRVALARALYSDADIYLLDDPIASLDAQVSEHVFTSAIQKYLSKKTVMLVTHQLQFLQKVDRVLVLSGGQIVENGSFDQLREMKNGILYNMISAYRFESNPAERIYETNSTSDIVTSSNAAIDFIEKEDKSEGSVNLKVLFRYFKSFGSFWVYILLGIEAFFTIAGMLGTPLILSQWTAAAEDDSNSFNYLLLYSTFGIMTALFQGFLFFNSLFATINASEEFHQLATKRLLKAPLQFFESNPIGRIINRFSADVQSMDMGIAIVLLSLLFSVIGVFVSVITIVIVSWYFVGNSFIVLTRLLVLLIVFFLIFYHIFKLYQPVNRDLKRLNSILKSPLDSHVTETLAGISTIHAYGQESIFIETLKRLLDHSQSASYLYSSLQNWLDFRLSVLASMITFSIATLAVNIEKPTVAFASVVGLALTYSSDFALELSMLLMHLGAAESEMNSVERLYHYGHKIPMEAPATLLKDSSITGWPNRANLTFRDFSVSYPSRPDHLILRNLNFTIKSGEKIGVVGRTGSGKSTLVTALFRIIEPKNGTIIIDGIDIQTMGLKTLRSQIQIIPQDPVLFEGTLRSNLDYEGNFTDEELWKSLEYVGLKKYVGELEGKLDYEVTYNGDNLSVGQRQLMCLCRSILKSPKILVMDEATASVDGESDQIIQKAISKHFGSTTVISIAHRLNTIAEFDRILVLDNGTVAEFDSPYNLLKNPTSIFSELTDASGPANATLIRELAARKALAI